MRKLWFRRRGVSTMIGGVIVLSLFLTALAAMIFVNRQYDSYQGTVNTMKQADMDSFSENLREVRPGLVPSRPAICPGGKTCTTYTMMITNLVTNASVNVGLQIARVYVNSTRLPGCTTLCILNPSKNAAPYAFQASQSYLNPGEFEHNVTLWFPSSITLPNSTVALNTVSITTTRGRQFSFLWPIPALGLASGSGGQGGGTGLYIGPLVITFQKPLITYSNSSNRIFAPIGGTNGGWVLPPPPFVLYVKIETDVGTPTDVYLTAQSVLELARFDIPGNIVPFFIVAPISLDLCALFHNQDPTINCYSSYGYYDKGNNGDPEKLQAYNFTKLDGRPCDPVPYSACPHRYKIPKPNTQQILDGLRGDPVIVAFAAATAGGNSQPPGQSSLKPGLYVTSYLGLTYVYNDLTGSGDYTYAVTLPFMAMCIDNSPKMCGI